MAKFLTIFLVFTGYACAPSKGSVSTSELALVSQSLVDGVSDPHIKRMYQVSAEGEKETVRVCTAVFIDQYVALTAGHCIFKDSATQACRARFDAGYFPNDCVRVQDLLDDNEEYVDGSQEGLNDLAVMTWFHSGFENATQEFIAEFWMGYPPSPPLDQSVKQLKFTDLPQDIFEFSLSGYGLKSDGLKEINSKPYIFEKPIGSDMAGIEARYTQEIGSDMAGIDAESSWNLIQRLHSGATCTGSMDPQKISFLNKDNTVFKIQENTTTPNCMPSPGDSGSILADKNGSLIAMAVQASFDGNHVSEAMFVKLNREFVRSLLDSNATRQKRLSKELFDAQETYRKVKQLEKKLSIALEGLKIKKDLTSAELKTQTELQNYQEKTNELRLKLRANFESFNLRSKTHDYDNFWDVVE